LDVLRRAFQEDDLHAPSRVMSAFGAGSSFSLSHESIQAFIASAEINFP